MKKLAAHEPAVKPAPEGALQEAIDALDTRIALIQALIPLGLTAVADLLQEEVTRLAGPRYDRKATDQACRRWGNQSGSVYLADQKLPIQVPECATSRGRPRCRWPPTKPYSNLGRSTKACSCGSSKDCPPVNMPPVPKPSRRLWPVVFDGIAPLYQGHGA